MNRRRVNRLLAMAVLSATVFAFSNESQAGWGTYGYASYGAPVTTWTAGYGGWGGAVYGADWCGYDCYDPCYVRYRPGLLARIANCWRNRWAGCATWPRWRVGYRYDPCCSVCYCDPCSCCDVCGGDPCGCGGGVVTEWGMGEVYEQQPAMEGPMQAAPQDPAMPEEPAPANPPADGDLPSVMPEQQTSQRLGNAILTVQVPDGTRIFVNGIATKSKGSRRQYVSRDLTPGYHYTYEVRAVTEQGGRPTVQTKTVHLRAGQKADLAFDMTSATTTETALTVNVPSDAKVYLAGNEATGAGMQRTFRTTKLVPGDAWKDYVVRVEVDRDGQTMSQEKTITLQAGDRRDLTFRFDVDQLAAAR